MTKSSFKKVSAAAVVAVLGLGAASQAATLYTTGFEAPTFTPGALAGQSGFVNASGTGTGTVVLGNAQTGTQAVQINSTTGGYTEFYNTATTLTNAQITGGTLSSSFGLERATPTGGQTTGGVPQGGTGAAEAGFGIEVFENSGTALASVFVRNTAAITTPTIQPSVPALFVQDSSGAANTEIFGAAGTAAADGAYGTYSLTMNFANSTFSVTGPGGTTSGIPFAAAYDGSGILGVTLSADPSGNDTAYFDNFSVAAGVPEPVSLGLVGMGSLMLMGRRRKQAAI